MTMKEHILDLAGFVVESPSSYHAAVAAADRLRTAGFVEQLETEPWDAAPGGYYVVRDGAIIAYRIPDVIGAEPRLRIVGAHTDSPGFKLKPHPEHNGFGWAQAGMEVYGGPLFNSWLDREFGLAGRVVTKSGQVHLVRTPAWFRIPQMAPHLDRSVNQSLHLDPQVNLMPIYGTVANNKGGLLAAIAEIAQIAPDDLAGHDLFSYIPQPPEVIGINGEFLASGRLDNLSSTHAGLIALIDAPETPGVIQLLACFDHEEIGSATRTGASGPFLEDVLSRTLTALGLNTDEAHRVFARSWTMSADAGHLLHPTYVGLYDPAEHPMPNRGPLLKVNAQQRYTSEGPGAALWTRSCEAAQVPHQVFVSNNSVPCGTTIGPLTATRLGIRSFDVGIGLLSMHSTRELCGVADPGYLSAAMEAFFSGV
jgi:aspartyl aminopeptidase